MQIALVGLGKMGGNMAQRWMRFGHEVIAYDRDPKAVAAVVEHGARGAASLEELVHRLATPRAVWTMLPAGDPTEQTLRTMIPLLSKGDVVIDGANANWKVSQRHAAMLQEHGISFVDCGTSGGVWGLEKGYCLMIGGDPKVVERLSPLFSALAPEDGWQHVGPVGAGHFVKMVHNGIEYGLMQAYAEGLEILHESPFSPDLAKVTKLWNHGSVVRSWLLELAQSAFEKEGDLGSIAGYVEDSGMGRWTVQAAFDENVPAPVLTLALQARLRSRQSESFAAKVCAALRNEFGGHAVKRT